MSRDEITARKVIALAYFHRYGWIAIMVGLVLIIPKHALQILGSCFLALSLWSLVGYKLKWKHIYCSFQNAHRKDMTPHHVCWSDIKKCEAYSIPLLFFVLGAAMLVTVVMLR